MKLKRQAMILSIKINISDFYNILNYLAQTLINPGLPLLCLGSGTFLAAIEVMQLEQNSNLHSEQVFWRRKKLNLEIGVKCNYRTLFVAIKMVKRWLTFRVRNPNLVLHISQHTAISVTLLPAWFWTRVLWSLKYEK